ncbi:MAG: UDP-glucose--hexose-1-phosphate uridylyltransferase, partial [Lachnospiraceae bacterium]|nr:UDP-glucose--hexose-1-phosphate uridylyltransferase [Lachnospiraceae bacterium]
MEISKLISKLVKYGIITGLVEKEDIIYTTNRLLMLFKVDEAYEGEVGEVKVEDLETILKGMLDYAYENKLMEDNSIVSRDLFDTKVMGCLVNLPSTIINKFYNLYKENPEKATNYFYKLSCDSDYIRRYRIKKDQKWITSTEYGDLDITINLSKPEKDPKAIAAAKLMKQSGYPKCLLCKENEGYAGRINHPARENHRIIPITINDSNWGFQYSPYVYYNEHCIVFNGEHVPMKIDKGTFKKLFDFVKQFPHYFVGSNADLPIVGGSILTHDHFQGGRYEFAMAKAKVEKEYTVKGFEDVKVGRVKWPMSVLRLSSPDSEKIIELADVILNKWRNYTDENAFIYAFTDNEPHNTITPIARKRGENFELDLVLRNNITTE